MPPQNIAGWQVEVGTFWIRSWKYHNAVIRVVVFGYFFSSHSAQHYECHWPIITVVYGNLYITNSYFSSLSTSRLKLSLNIVGGSTLELNVFATV